MLEWVNSHFWNLISYTTPGEVILFIIGTVLSLVLYFKGKHAKQPFYAIRNINLINRKIEKIRTLQISYNKTPVEDLSVARLALWNRGKDTITSSDIAQANPLVICALDGVDILDAEIIFEKTNENNFRVTRMRDRNGSIRNKFRITFDYVDKNEGVIVQLLHTGKSSDDLRMDGTIKGVGCIRKLADPFFRRMVDRQNELAKFLFGGRYGKTIIATLIFIVPLIPLLSFLTLPYEIPKGSKTFDIVFSLVSIAVYWPLAISLLRRRLPKGFDLFEAEIRSL